MFSPGPEVRRLAGRFELGLHPPRRGGPAGERLGRGTGSSLEFQDRRAYAPGDDVRHLDWRAMARSDQVLVRLYREEVAPALDLLLDGSRSMAVEPEKAQLALDVAALFAAVAEESGAQARLFLLSDGARRLDLRRLEREGLEYDSTDDLAVCVEAALPLLRPGSLRVLVSDGLVPHPASALARPLAARAGALALVQVLGRFDLEPSAGEALRLTDSETGSALDLVLDERVVAAYRTRLRRRCDELETECRRASGRYALVSAAEDLEAASRGVLSREGLLAPR